MKMCYVICNVICYDMLLCYIYEWMEDMKNSTLPLRFGFLHTKLVSHKYLTSHQISLSYFFLLYCSFPI